MAMQEEVVDLIRVSIQGGQVGHHSTMIGLHRRDHYI
jgi:hypothetical protein